MQDEIDKLKEENELLKKQITISNGSGNIIVNDIGVNNGTVDNSVNTITITLCNYTTPYLDKDMIPASLIKHYIKENDSVGLISKLTELIYRNPKYPQNHSIYLPNIKQSRVMVYEDGWKSKEDIKTITPEISNSAYDVCAMHEIDDDGTIQIDESQEKEFVKTMKPILHKKIT